MSPGTRARLLSLADQEFRSLTEGSTALPAPPRFKALKLNIAKFDTTWDHKRGSAVRLAGVLLRDDDAALTQRVTENNQVARTYESGVDLLRREAAYLRKVARLLDLAGGRLTAVLQRRGGTEAASAT
jgi:hypothetical protein